MHGVRLDSAAWRIVRGLAQIAAGDEPRAVPMYPLLVVESAKSRPWTSATFDGEIHLLELLLRGDSDVIGDALDRIVEHLPHADFLVPGQLVAEIKILRVSVDADPNATAIALTIEALTVVD